MCGEQQGRYAEALEEMRRPRDLSGGNLLMIGFLGHAYGTAVLDFAYVHSRLKDKEITFEWLEKA